MLNNETIVPYSWADTSCDLIIWLTASHFPFPIFFGAWKRATKYVNSLSKFIISAGPERRHFPSWILNFPIWAPICLDQTVPHPLPIYTHINTHRHILCIHYFMVRKCVLGYEMPCNMVDINGVSEELVTSIIRAEENPDNDAMYSSKMMVHIHQTTLCHIFTLLPSQTLQSETQISLILLCYDQGARIA